MCSGISVSGQNYSQDMVRATAALKRNDFRQASDIFIRHHTRVITDKKYCDQAARAYYRTNRVSETIEAFANLEKREELNRNQYLKFAECYAEEGDFELAAQWVKRYMGDLDTDSWQYHHLVHQLKQYGQGRRLQRNAPKALVEPLSSKINTIYDEYSPHFSPTVSDKYYYTQAKPGNVGAKQNDRGILDPVHGVFKGDIFYAQKENGLWTVARSIDQVLNSSMHDRVVGFGQKGNVMFFSRSHDGHRGYVYQDSFLRKIGDIHYPILRGVFDTILREIDMCLFQDSIILFSSNRIGGYGDMIFI